MRRVFNTTMTVRLRTKHADAIKRAAREREMPPATLIRKLLLKAFSEAFPEKPKSETAATN